MSALRALLRVELRELRRHPARSWLVILLVAVPVAAMVGGSALLVTARPTEEERRAALLGAADLRVEVEDADGARELEHELPAEASSVTIVQGVARTDRGVSVEVLELDPAPIDAERLVNGLLEVVRGRMPAAREVALSPAASRVLAVDLGQDLILDGEHRRVSGVVRSPEELARVFVVCPRRGDDRFPRSVLVSYAEPELLAARLRALDHDVSMRMELGEADPFEAVVVFVCGGFALFECGLIIAAAFAVGLRRRQRELGLLAACGAERWSLRAGLALSAIAFAGIGSVLGVAAGIAGAFALHPFQDGWNGRANGALELERGYALGACGLALVAASIAVALPALGATRLPIRVALAGRRPISEGSRAWFAVGALLLGLGVTAVVLGAGSEGPSSALGILAGSACAVLGFGAASPELLGWIARFAAPLPLAARLAVRDTGRFRARNGPVVTAILAAMAVGVMLSVLARAVQARAGESGDASTDTFLVAAVFACLATGLVIVFVATALSAVEAAHDARTLHLLGADPSVLRMIAAARASYLAAVGASLALPAGLLPGFGLLALANVDLEFGLPWPTLAAVMLGLPAAAFLSAWSLFGASIGALPRS